MKRALTYCMTAGAAILLAFAAAPGPDAIGAAPAPSAGDEVKACTLTTFKTDLVKAACEKGGQAEAKAVMKDRVKQWKAASGEKITCKTCHESLTEYELKDSAHTEFTRLEALLTQKESRVTPAERAAIAAHSGL